MRTPKTRLLATLPLLMIGLAAAFHWALLAHRFDSPALQAYAETLYERALPRSEHAPLSWIWPTVLPIPPFAGLSEPQFQGLLAARTQPFPKIDPLSRGDDLTISLSWEVRDTGTNAPELITVSHLPGSFGLQLRLVSVPGMIAGTPAEDRIIPFSLHQGYAKLKIPAAQASGEYWLIVSEAPSQSQPDALDLLPHLKPMRAPADLVASLPDTPVRTRLIFARKVFLFGTDGPEFRSKLQTYQAELAASRQEARVFAQSTRASLRDLLADLRGFEATLSHKAPSHRLPSPAVQKEAQNHAADLLGRLAPLETRLNELSAHNPHLKAKGYGGLYQLTLSALSTLRYAASELGRAMSGKYPVTPEELARHRRLCVEAELAQKRLELKTAEL